MFANDKQELVNNLAHLIIIVLKAKKYPFSLHRLVWSIFDVVTSVNYGH